MLKPDPDWRAAIDTSEIQGDDSLFVTTTTRSNQISFQQFHAGEDNLGYIINDEKAQNINQKVSAFWEF